MRGDRGQRRLGRKALAAHVRQEVAQLTLTPSLSSSTATAPAAPSIAIRSVGTTLIDTVQPGVGIFVDGIYQPNTSPTSTTR